jgi:hypothetical protein
MVLGTVIGFARLNRIDVESMECVIDGQKVHFPWVQCPPQECAFSTGVDSNAVLVKTESYILDESDFFDQCLGHFEYSNYWGATTFQWSLECSGYMDVSKDEYRFLIEMQGGGNVDGSVSTNATFDYATKILTVKLHCGVASSRTCRSWVVRYRWDKSQRLWTLLSEQSG